MDLAVVEVRDRIDRVRHLLPDDLRQLRIRRFQSTDIPIVRFHLSAEWPMERLFEFAEDVVQRRLERLEGVAQVDINGLRTREVQVRLDAARMAAHGVDVRRLTEILRANHQNLSGGHVLDGSRKLLVRSVGELQTLEEIRLLPLDDQGLRLRDVAEVAYAFPEQESFDFLNGAEALTVRIYKASTANLLNVVDRVKAELETIGAEPGNEALAWRVYRDSSVDVRKGLGQLRNAGLVGGSLAILAVFAFIRRWRTTAIIAVAIPVSVVFTFVLMFLIRQAGWAEVTLNVVSLMGLVLALGMLVDSSIVVLESIYRHVEVLGEDARTAALRGASEVAMPILASTATTLCVFVPVIFLGSGSGFFSRYLTEIGTSVCIVMVASLLVALTVVPMAASILLGREKAPPKQGLGWLSRAYGALLGATLRHRMVLFALALGMLWGSWKLFGGIERTFNAGTQERQVTINVDTPRSYTEEQTQGLFREVAALLESKSEELDIADVTYSYHLGSGRSRSRFRRKSFEIYLVDESEARLTTVEARDRIRGLLPVKAGVGFRIARSTYRHGSGGLEVQLSGDDPAVLELLGRDAASRLAAVGGVQDVDLSLESGDDEISIRVERERAVQAGISSRAVAATVQSALTSRALSYLKTEDREIDLVVQYREEDRETLSQLQNVALFTEDAALPLDALAAFEVGPGPRSLERENRQSKITITANVSSPMAAMAAQRGAAGVMASMAMPPGYSWSFRPLEPDGPARPGRLGLRPPLRPAAGLHVDGFSVRELGLSVLHHGLGALRLHRCRAGDEARRTASGQFHRARIPDPDRRGGQQCHRLGGSHQPAPVRRARPGRSHPPGRSRPAAGHSHDRGDDDPRPSPHGGADPLSPVLRPLGRPRRDLGPGRPRDPRRLDDLDLPHSDDRPDLLFDLRRSDGLLETGGTGGMTMARKIWETVARLGLAALLVACAACGGASTEEPGAGRAAGGDSRESSRGNRGGGRPGGPPGGGPPGFGRGGPQQDRGVPVEVAAVERAPISLYFETQGTLEAENEVDLVARQSGPITELAAEEGMRVGKGRLLARIDDAEVTVQLQVAKIRLEETRLAFERAQTLYDSELLSQEAYDQAVATFQSARGEVERLEVQVRYTEVKAPFSGQIVRRYVRFAEHVSTGQQLFRISDFDPLLCPIQVPERELPRLRLGQPARLSVEAFPGRRFEARVLRISPVVDAASGTVRVTLEASGEGVLRPGMFASVELEMENRPSALVIPKSALALDSLGDTVFVAAGEVAERRQVELGFRNEDRLEILSGLAEGERVVVVGQDGLSEGTPIEILAGPGAAERSVPEASEPDSEAPARGAWTGAPGQGRGEGRPGPSGRPGGGPPDFRNMSPEDLERMKGVMRQRGLTDEQIEERIRNMRERSRDDGE